MSVETRKVDDLLTNALLKKQSGDYIEAERLLSECVKILDSEKKPDFSKLSSSLAHLADCYARQAKHKEARETYERLTNAWMTAIKKDDADVFMDIDYLASTFDFGTGTNDIADCYAKIIDAKKQVFGANHPDIANSLTIYSRLLSRLGRKEEAETVENEAKEMQKVRGKD